MAPWAFGAGLEARWFQGLFYAGLLAGAVMDMVRRRIPNVFTVPFLIGGLVLACVQGGWEGLREALGGVVAGFLPLFLPFALGLVGGGDVKFMAAAGSFLGPAPALMAVGVGFVTGGLFIAGLLLRRPGLRKEVGQNLWAAVLTRSLPAVERRPAGLSVPLGAALALGAFLTHHFGWGR